MILIRVRRVPLGANEDRRPVAAVEARDLDAQRVQRSGIAAVLGKTGRVELEAGDVGAAFEGVDGAAEIGAGSAETGSNRNVRDQLEIGDSR